MDAALTAAAAWLEASGFSSWAKESPSAYPVANVVHLLGLVMLVGGIGVIDLRAAGLWRAIPLAPLVRALTPVAIAGIFVLAGSGSVLFAADARALATSDTFQLKLLLIVAALANAFLFRLFWGRAIALTGEAPRPARLMATISLLLWLGVATAGRMIAYS